MSSQDGKLSAQFEQTMVVTDTGVEVCCHLLSCDYTVTQVLTARQGKRHTAYFMDS